MAKIGQYIPRRRLPQTLGAPVERRSPSQAVTLRQPGRHTPNLPVYQGGPPNPQIEWAAARAFGKEWTQVFTANMEDYKKRQDATNVVDLMNQYSEAERQFKSDTVERKGKDAATVYDDAQAWIKKQSEVLGEGVENDEQQLMFTQRFAAASDKTLDFALNWKTQQDEVARNQALKGTIAQSMQAIFAAPTTRTVQDQIIRLREDLDALNPAGVGGDNVVELINLKQRMYTTALEQQTRVAPAAVESMIKYINKREKGLFDPKTLQGFQDAANDQMIKTSAVNTYTKLLGQWTTGEDYFNNPEKANEFIDDQFPIRESMSDDEKSQMIKAREASKAMYRTQRSVQKAVNKEKNNRIVKNIEAGFVQKLFDEDPRQRLSPSDVMRHYTTFEKAGVPKRLFSWMTAAGAYGNVTSDIEKGRMLMEIQTSQPDDDDIVDQILTNDGLHPRDIGTLIQSYYNKKTRDTLQDAKDEETQLRKTDQKWTTAAHSLFREVASGAKKSARERSNLSAEALFKEVVKFDLDIKQKDLHGEDIYEHAKKLLAEVVKGVFYWEVDEPSEVDAGTETGAANLSRVYKSMSWKERRHVRRMLEHRAKWYGESFADTNENIARVFLNNLERLYEYDFSAPHRGTTVTRPMPADDSTTR